MINRETYEEYFLLYIDGELTAAERAEVEKFAEENPELKKELDLLTASVFVADETIVFGNKEVLYKNERDRAAILFTGWRRLAAAAAVLLFLGGGWIYFYRDIASSGNEHNRMLTPLSHKITTEEKRPEMASANPAPERTRTIPQVKTKITAAKPRPRTTNANPAPESVAETLISAEPAGIVEPVAINNDFNKEINIPVLAKNITPQTIPVPDRIQYIDEDNPQDNNRIYFANTSIPKRNSLRVVFRKASRIIDRITTFQ